jgi:hypothetical protein
MERNPGWMDDRGRMTRKGLPRTWKVFRALVVGGLGLLYALGLIISARAILLFALGKETGPGGHSYPAWTILHFASAFLFAALAVLQVLPILRRRYPMLHRCSGRIAVFCGLIAAVTGAFIPFAVIPPRPLLERLYIVIYFTGVASFLLLGYRSARRHEYPLHRRWMIRAVASAGAVVTQRIVFPILAIAFGIRHEAAFWAGFVAAFALGWAINLALAEVWLWWSSIGSTEVSQHKATAVV